MVFFFEWENLCCMDLHRSFKGFPLGFYMDMSRVHQGTLTNMHKHKGKVHHDTHHVFYVLGSSDTAVVLLKGP